MTKKKTAPQPKQQADEFGFTRPDVDESIMDKEQTFYPSIIWMSKFDPATKGQSRPWVVDIENLSRMPEPYWKEGMVQFGQDPNEPPTPVYMTEVMRVCPLGIRMRQIVTDNMKNLHYYPIYTEPANRVKGRIQLHYQVQVVLPGLPTNEIAVLALKGMTRTLSWRHNGKYDTQFPIGVQNELLEYSKAAGKAVGGAMPMWAAWWIELRGVYRDNKPYFVAVGPNNDTYVQPFSVDLRTGEEGMPNTRYVGEELYYKFQGLRRDITLDWIAEWSDEKMKQTASEPNAGSFDATANTEEDSEIPF